MPFVHSNTLVRKPKQERKISLLLNQGPPTQHPRTHCLQSLSPKLDFAGSGTGGAQKRGWTLSVGSPPYSGESKVLAVVFRGRNPDDPVTP